MCGGAGCAGPCLEGGGGTLGPLEGPMRTPSHAGFNKFVKGPRPSSRLLLDPAAETLDPGFIIRLNNLSDQVLGFPNVGFQSLKAKEATNAFIVSKE